MKIRFSFDVEMPDEKGQRFTKAFLPLLAEWVAVTMPKSFPSMEGKTQLLEAKIVREGEN